MPKTTLGKLPREAIRMLELPRVAPDILEGFRNLVDLTGTLSATEKASIEAELARLETETGSQVAVLVVDTTAPEAIEQYALRVAEAWQLGRADIDDGVLFLVALADRRMLDRRKHVFGDEIAFGLVGVAGEDDAHRIRPALAHIL